MLYCFQGLFSSCQCNLMLQQFFLWLFLYLFTYSAGLDTSFWKTNALDYREQMAKQTCVGQRWPMWQHGENWLQNSSQTLTPGSEQAILSVWELAVVLRKCTASIFTPHILRNRRQSVCIIYIYINVREIGTSFERKGVLNWANINFY